MGRAGEQGRGSPVDRNERLELLPIQHLDQLKSPAEVKNDETSRHSDRELA